MGYYPLNTPKVPGRLFKFLPLEVMSRYRDPQLEVGEKCLIWYRTFY